MGWGRGQNYFFSEYGLVAYQIKAYNACSSMVSNILPTDTRLTQGWGQKVKLYIFSESSHVAYQIKAADAGSNMVGNIMPTYILDPGDGVKRSNNLFLNVVLVHIKFKGN